MEDSKNMMSGVQNLSMQTGETKSTATEDATDADVEQIDYDDALIRFSGRYQIFTFSKYSITFCRLITGEIPSWLQVLAYVSFCK